MPTAIVLPFVRSRDSSADAIDCSADQIDESDYCASERDAKQEETPELQWI